MRRLFNLGGPRSRQALEQEAEAEIRAVSGMPLLGPTVPDHPPEPAHGADDEPQGEEEPRPRRARRSARRQ